MSYLVSIVRTRNRAANPLSRREIESLVQAHPDLQIAESEIGEFDLIELKDGRERFRFVFQSGELWTKEPREEELQSMLELAALLGARVRGDDFETYRTPLDTYSHPDDEAEVEAAEAAAKRHSQIIRTRQRTLNLAIITFFVLLAAIVAYFSA